MPAFISQGVNGHLTSQFDKTNTTLTDVPGMSFNLRAGQVYNFWFNFMLSAPAGGGVKIGMAGTVGGTSFHWNLNVWNGTTMLIGSSLNTATSVGVTAAATYAEIFGGIVVSSAGSLVPQFAQNAASGTSSILQNSSGLWLQREPMNPYA